MNIAPAPFELAERPNEMLGRAPVVSRGVPVLVLEPAGALARHQAAFADLVGGLRLWRLALTLGWLDIKLRYRGSALGPFWLTLSTAVMVGALGLVWGTLFKMDMHSYLPFLGLSLVLWGSGISGLATDACTAFTQADGTIRSIRMPFSVQIIRTLVRNAIVLGHNVVVPVGVFAIYDAWPGTAAVWSIPGILLWTLDGVAACMVLGTISARFRDIPPIVGSILQIAFYVTPVIYKPSQISLHLAWMAYNPFDDLLEIVRGPLLGHPPSLKIVALACAWSLVLWLAGWLSFVRARGRLAFWV